MTGRTSGAIVLLFFLGTLLPCAAVAQADRSREQPSQRPPQETPPPTAPRPRAPGSTPLQNHLAWLRAAHKKVKKDSEKLTTLAQELRAEAFNHQHHSLTPEVLERIQALEKRAEELQREVEAVDENFLSVTVITEAREIEDEAEALQDLFAEQVPGRPGGKLRELAREIEKRADSIADRMRLP